MAIRLRQIALVGADLDASEQQIEAAIGASVCYRDPGVAEFGLHNVLYRLGDTFLEVVVPTQDGTTAGRLLEKRGGDGGYMAIFETDDLPATRQRIEDHGARIVYEAVTPGITGLHLHPRDVGGAIVSIDVTDTWGEWPWCGPAWKSHPPAADAGVIIGATIQAEDPAGMAARWADVLGVAPPSSTSEGAAEIELSGSTIRFVAPADGRGEGLSGITCEAAGANQPGSQRAFGGITVDFA